MKKLPVRLCVGCQEPHNKRAKTPPGAETSACCGPDAGNFNSRRACSKCGLPKGSLYDDSEIPAD